MKRSTRLSHRTCKEPSESSSHLSKSLWSRSQLSRIRRSNDSEFKAEISPHALMSRLSTSGLERLKCSSSRKREVNSLKRHSTQSCTMVYGLWFLSFSRKCIFTFLEFLSSLFSYSGTWTVLLMIQLTWVMQTLKISKLLSNLRIQEQLPRFNSINT